MRRVRRVSRMSFVSKCEGTTGTPLYVSHSSPLCSETWYSISALSLMLRSCMALSLLRTDLKMFRMA